MNRKEKLISWIIVVVVLLVFAGFASILGNKSEVKEEELEMAVDLNLDGDFPNPKEGTAIFNNKIFMDRVILQFKKVPKYIIFFESKTIPGLIFRYNAHDSVFEGGLPLIRSEEVTYLDGNTHEIIYTFKEGAEQRIFFDGKEIALGNFDSSKIGIIGFAVTDIAEYDIQNMDIDGDVEFK